MSPTVDSAGKTVACINDILTRALATSKKNAQYAYISPYFVQSKQIAWEYIKRYGDPIISRSNESELWVEVPSISGTPSRIYLLGADNQNRLRGMFLDGCVIDEPADIRTGFFGTVIRPMLADRKGWCVWIGTPKGHNEFYDIYRRSVNDPEWFSLRLRASESGLIDPEELRGARRDMTEDQYEQEMETSFEAAIHGAVYGRWMAEAEKSGRIRPIDYDRSIRVNTAWDLGYDDATAIWFYQVLRGEIRVIDYYEANGEDIQHYCDVIKNRDYKYGKHYVPHDAANKLLAAGGRSIVEQARTYGLLMHVVNATSQQNSIEATRKTIERCWFDPKCEQGIEALKQYQFEYDEERKVFRSKPRHDWSSHASDAFEVIGQTWRIPPEEPTEREINTRMPTIKELFDEHFASRRDED